jgi:hypothetical protein
MRRARRQHLRHAASLLFVALLLVPVAFRGHMHAGHAQQSQPCATCLVAFHAPLAQAPSVAAIDPVFFGAALEASALAGWAGNDRPVAHGRAPPAHLPAQVA